jgi:hypothetical protein
LLSLAALIGVAPVRAVGSTYYVSPTGRDQGAGSLADPWRSPAYGAQRLSPGDTLVLGGGTYVLASFEDDILRPPSGRADAWITLQAAPGQSPILAGRDDLNVAIDLAGVHHVRIEGLEITSDLGAPVTQGGLRDGISALGVPAHDIVIRSVHIHHVDEFGLNLQDVYNVRVENSQIAYCGFGAAGGPEADQGGWRQVTIADSTLSYSGHYYRGGDGQDRPYDRPDGLGVEPAAGPLTVVRCRAEHNRGDGLDSKVAATTIDRCIVANNSCDGVKLWAPPGQVVNTLIYGRGDSDSQPTDWSALVLSSETPGGRYELTNVTIDDTCGQNYVAHVQYGQPSVRLSLALRNCIIRAVGQRTAFYVASTTQLAVDHTLFYMPASSVVVTHGDQDYDQSALASLGEAVLYGDPLFVAPGWGTEGDYHVLPGSPAIDWGTAEGAPAWDLEGRQRLGAPDLGAYELAPSARPALLLPLIMRG